MFIVIMYMQPPQLAATKGMLHVQLEHLLAASDDGMLREVIIG